MSDCLFCKIIAGEIPSQKVYEDANVLAFRDINPQAPTHILAVPKQHVASLDDINAANIDIAANVLAVIPKIAAAESVSGGYRVVTNIGADGGQTVEHLHFHIIGGRKLGDKFD